MIQNESIRAIIYLVYTIALAVGAVISFVRGDTAQGLALLALLFPTGLAVSNTSFKG